MDKEKEMYFLETRRELELISAVSKEEDCSKIEENIFLMPLQYKYTHNLITGHFENVEGVDRVLGYENCQFTLDFYYGIIHPEDIEITFEMTRKGTQWVDHNGYVNPCNSQLNILQRIKRINNEYAYIFRQSTVIESIGSKYVKSFSICTDVTAMGIKAMKPAYLYVYNGANFNHSKVFNLSSEKWRKLLTHRETDILFWVTEGYTSKDIGHKLNISKHTVDTHRRNIHKKTGLKTAFELKEIFQSRNS